MKVAWHRIALLMSLAFFAEPVFAIPVSEIRFEGVPVELVDQARVVGAFNPGDEYESSRAERSRLKLTEYFTSKGYPDARVVAEIVRDSGDADLVFRAKLGSPLRISMVRFDAKEGKIHSELLQRLQAAVDWKPGEPLDRDRIREMRRAVDSVLGSQNFIDSRVIDIVIEPAKEGPVVRFDVFLGQKVVLSVQGNEAFSRAELMSIIESQRAIGLGRDYVSVLVDRIRSEYIDHGYRQVQITPLTFEATGDEPKKLIFKIEEGQRARIRNLDFEGNEIFTDSELTEVFYRLSSDRIRARIYNGKMVDDAAAALIEELKNRGYLSAKLIAIKTEESEAGSGVRIRCFVNEGVQTRIQSIDFRGNVVIDQPRLLALLGFTEGEPLSLPKLEDGIDRIKQEYRNLGYMDFLITNESDQQLVSYSEKNQFAYLSFDFDEGGRYSLGKFEIYGNDATRRKVIEREILVRPGETLGEGQIQATEDNLRRLGIFSQVNLESRNDPELPQVRDLKVSVQEAVPGNSTAGIGFRNDLGIRTFGGVSYSNLWGLNHTWALDVTLNRRLTIYRFMEYTAQVTYTMPWAFLGPTTFKPSLSAEKRQYIQFDAETFAFNMNLDRMLYSPLRISGSLGYALERVRQFNAIDATQNQQITIGSITPTLRIDLRDDPYSPKRGFYATGSFEFADSFLGTQTEPVPVSYGRFRARADYYLNLIPNLVWYWSVRGGWLKNYVSPLLPDGTVDPRITVPLIKQFALGGVNSIRGFAEQEINVQARDPDRRVQGSLSYVNYRTQMDFFANPNLAVGPFLDAGNLQLDAFSLGNLRLGSGVGMRYLTPVGPVNFDWGFKLHPRPGESPSVFYFSLGVI